MTASTQTQHLTQLLRVDPDKIGKVKFDNPSEKYLGDWKIELSNASPDAAYLAQAALLLRTTDTPVAFATETVYGLGADATRSSAVLGIYKAKQRPSDNPLIVHVSSLNQLRRLLKSQDHESPSEDPIPAIYRPLIARFWPGPLTILLPLPNPSTLAPQVNASLPTFAARMPSSRLALALINLAGTPLAAPSANSSGKPSPTTALHVFEDLNGRIDLILDGGPCDVGVESTVVDGLSSPPVILRPGGVSMEMLRECHGWENVVPAYKDRAEGETPRAPGMKYKHYSPRAKVVLVTGHLDVEVIRQHSKPGSIIGLLKTKHWQSEAFEGTMIDENHSGTSNGNGDPNQNGVESTASASVTAATLSQLRLNMKDGAFAVEAWSVALGNEVPSIARGLFSALRELDVKGVSAIFVESIDDSEGHEAAAVMNRLRKAAEVEIQG